MVLIVKIQIKQIIKQSLQIMKRLIRDCLMDYIEEENFSRNMGLLEKDIAQRIYSRLWML